MLKLALMTASRPPSRSVILALLAAGQLVFAACCSPAGVRSGQWAVPGLPTPDFLVFLTSGAMMIHPWMLYPLWAGLGSTNLFRRYATVLMLCVAFYSVNVVRSLARDTHEPPAAHVVTVLHTFAWTTLCFGLVHWFSRWRLGIPGIPPTDSGTRRHRWNLQFRLRHLFECTALTAAVLALYRFYFPDGLPTDFVAGLREHFSRSIRGIPFGILTLLPTISIPWMVLALRRERSAVLWITAAIVFFIASDSLLVWMRTIPRYFAWSEILAAQLGASASGAISAIVLRAVGYRLARE